MNGEGFLLNSKKDTDDNVAMILITNSRRNALDDDIYNAYAFTSFQCSTIDEDETVCSVCNNLMKFFKRKCARRGDNITKDYVPGRSFVFTASSPALTMKCVLHEEKLKNKLQCSLYDYTCKYKNIMNRNGLDINARQASLTFNDEKEKV